MSGKDSLVGIDTSIVLRLLTGQPTRQAKRAVRFLDELAAKGKSASVSDLVIAETYFALQFHYEVPRATAIESLRAFAGSEEIVCLGAAGTVLAAGVGSGPGLVDRLIHGEYMRFCAKMATFERAARKLPGTEVLVAAN
jgi:predicted nucleic acid-binding protein